MAEGQRVRYVGDDTMVQPGTIGRVLAASVSAQHIIWLEGACKDRVDLIPNDDVVPYRGEEQGFRSASLGDIDENVGLLTFAVRDTYDEGGEEALMTALGEAGYLAPYSEYAASAVALIAGSLRRDPTFQAVLAQLDEVEAESLLVRVSMNLILEET